MLYITTHISKIGNFKELDFKYFGHGLDLEISS